MTTTNPTPTDSILTARRWFQEARFGMFIHWGIYSVLGEGEWVMEINKIPIPEYEKLAPQFNPTAFDPAAWVALAKRAGMKYIVITSRHHDGFALWDSRASDYNIVKASPYGRDALKMLAAECARQGIKLGFYYSHLDWRHSDYYPLGWTGHHSGRTAQGDFNRYVDYMLAQLAELLGGQYGEVACIWFDGWWDQQVKKVPSLGRPDAPPIETQIDWRLEETYELIHLLQPQCLIGCNHHVAPFPGEDIQMFEKDLPGANTAGFNTDISIGQLPLETCETIGTAWGYHKGEHDLKSSRELTHYLIKAAGMDANFLLNIGPKPDGTIQPEFVERLEAIGSWMKVNSESIYGTRGGPIVPQAWGVSTQNPNKKKVYLHILEPSQATAIALPPELKSKSARLLNSGQPVPIQADGTLQYTPAPGHDPVAQVVVLE